MAVAFESRDSAPPRQAERPQRVPRTAHGGAPRGVMQLGKNALATAPSRCPERPITLSPPAPGAMFGDDGMADHGEVEYATATGNDYPAHEQTYENFITLVKVVMAIVVTIVVLMAYFLT
jgi:hypothetical protein